MQNGIPDHARRIALLRDLLEIAYKKVGSGLSVASRACLLPQLGGTTRMKLLFATFSPDFLIISTTLTVMICYGFAFLQMQATDSRLAS